jgi:hypothetical protein
MGSGLLVPGSQLKLSRREPSTSSSSKCSNTAEGRNDLPLGDCPWLVNLPKRSCHYPSGFRFLCPLVYGKYQETPKYFAAMAQSELRSPMFLQNSTHHLISSVLLEECA